MSKDAGLKIAFTPDSDDAFYYRALETGRVRMPGFLPTFHCDTIGNLNHAARTETYDVTAISAVAYPSIAHRYAILSVGTSVGRGYGPVLVSREACSLDALAGKKVGVGGIPTTGWFLLRRLCPEAIPVVMPFDQIGKAVLDGDLAAGVMIHEELLFYPQLGLQRVIDLGAEWCRLHQLPLPVGLNVARRILGNTALELIRRGIRRSLEYALAHREETLEGVSEFGRGMAGKCTAPFVEMFANEDSLDMPEDVREALRILMQEAIEEGLTDLLPPLDIVDGVSNPRSRKTKQA
jgi:1,4-dihydroxy-6-naphthoate synthase